MARVRERGETNGGPLISIIGPGMRVMGDVVADGSVRVEGVVTGAVHAGKGVVVGRDGSVDGDVSTHDAVIAGTVRGRVVAASRLEIQATAHIEGEIRARRVQLDEGAVVNGSLEMGDVTLEAPMPAPPPEDVVAPRSWASADPEE
jgi:cytoskeletal protein CcmA (bactofilin family)